MTSTENTNPNGPDPQLPDPYLVATFTTAQVAAPVADIRDIVETYRRTGRVGPVWRHSLHHAARQLRDHDAPAALQAGIAELVAQVDVLVHGDGMRPGAVLDRASALTAALLDAIRVPGLPHPSDPDWTFEAPDRPQDLR